MTSALGIIAVLALVGALLHLAWHLVLASCDAALGIGLAILAASMIRVVVVRALAWLWLHTFGGMLVR